MAMLLVAMMEIKSIKDVVHMELLLVAMTGVMLEPQRPLSCCCLITEEFATKTIQMLRRNNNGNSL